MHPSRQEASGPLQDLTVWDATVSAPGAEVSARRVSLRLVPSDLLRGRLHLAWVDVEGLRISQVAATICYPISLSLFFRCGPSSEGAQQRFYPEFTAAPV